MSQNSELSRWMKANSVKDELLSQRVGVSRVQIRRIRLGENRPSPETALKIQEVTGIPAADLIFGAATQ